MNGTDKNKQPIGVVLPGPFEMRPFQTVDQGSTNYKAGFNAALRKVRERLNSPTISDGCDTCHGQGEVWSGETAYQGHFQPPEPIMDVCPECSGESVPTVSAGVTLPDDFVCGSKPLQDLLNATAMLLETPSQDSATYWTAQLANVEALLKPVSAGVVDERSPALGGYAAVSIRKDGDLHIVIDATERLANARAQHWREKGYVSNVAPVMIPTALTAQPDHSAQSLNRVPDEWRVSPVTDNGVTGFVIGTPRGEDGIRSNTSVWIDDDDPAHQLLAIMLAASPAPGKGI